MTHSFLFVLLQAAPAGGGMLQLVLLGGMILVFWLFMIRPQAKKAKLAKKFQEEMQKGDKIVTIAGIHGTVNKVNDDGTIQIETSPGSYLKIEKSAISIEWTQNLNKPATATADKK
jgi:preprotein translocase subunit YajC